MILFIAGIFGGLGLGVVLGFILGSRAQRALGLIFKLEAAKLRGSPSKLDEFEEPIERKGAEHPIGLVPPTPDEIKRRTTGGGGLWQKLQSTMKPR